MFPCNGICITLVLLILFLHFFSFYSFPGLSLYKMIQITFFPFLFILLFYYRDIGSGKAYIREILHFFFSSPFPFTSLSTSLLSFQFIHQIIISLSSLKISEHSVWKILFSSFLRVYISFQGYYSVHECGEVETSSSR